MITVIDPSFHMWFVLLLTGAAVFLFSNDKIPLEVTSVAILTVLLLFGQIVPLPDVNGRNLLDAAPLLAGFANPALISVIGLLVMGQAIIHTDALRGLIQFFVKSKLLPPWLSIVGIMVFVMIFSAFLNNTPLVVLAIPIMQAIANAAGISESRVMIPLSFAAILGGMATLIGSSTNLLVSSAMVELGYNKLEFFDFFVPGSMLAVVGFIYSVTFLPRLLPDRRSLKAELRGDEKEFIAELDIGQDSRLIGMECIEGHFPTMPELSIRLIQRSGHLILPPFEGYSIQAGDILIVAATRQALTDMLAKYDGFMLAEEDNNRSSSGVKASLIKNNDIKRAQQGQEREEEEEEGQEDREAEKQHRRAEQGSENGDESDSEDQGQDQNQDQDDQGPAELDKQVAETRILAEIMITPGSRMTEMTIDQVGFHRQFGATVLGIQRRARTVRRRLGRIRLEAGDVLLVAGSQGSINDMRNNRDLIVLSGSKQELAIPKKAPVAGLIFLGTVLAASTGFLTISVAVITGSILLIATGCLNVRQATRAIDRKIILLVGSMLALGVALQATQGAQFIAELILRAPYTEIPLVLAALLFIIVAISTNILSNNACAILFTPIAMSMAVNVGVDPFIFAVTVIFAANCSFASPIGYKTNLLVMGPGHYRFRDFFKAGIPLVILMWGAYILIAKFYYHL